MDDKNGNGSSLTEEEREYLEGVVKQLKYENISCSRLLKTKNGDFFVNHRVSWDGNDSPVGNEVANRVKAEPNTQGVKLLTAIVSMIVDEQCYLNARDSGALTEAQADRAIANLRTRYFRRITELVRKRTNE